MRDSIFKLLAQNLLTPSFFPVSHTEGRGVGCDLHPRRKTTVWILRQDGKNLGRKDTGVQ